MGYRIKYGGQQFIGVKEGMLSFFDHHIYLWFINIGLSNYNVHFLYALFIFSIINVNFLFKALLCRVASTSSGAEMLLEQNALSCLSTLNVYNKHPEITTNIPL